MYLAGHWYLLSPVESAGNSGYKASSDAGNGLLTGTGSDPVEQLDVTRLQERILGPVLGIDDPRTDERLRFSGGTASSRSEEHTSALQSLMRNSYAVFCLTKNSSTHTHTT